MSRISSRRFLWCLKRDKIWTFFLYNYMGKKFTSQLCFMLCTELWEKCEVKKKKKKRERCLGIPKWPATRKESACCVSDQVCLRNQGQVPTVDFRQQMMDARRVGGFQFILVCLGSNTPERAIFHSKSLRRGTSSVLCSHASSCMNPVVLTLLTLSHVQKVRHGVWFLSPLTYDPTKDHSWDFVALYLKAFNSQACTV